ncbi:MAG: TetR family transcriptional regulator [Pseudonocardiaceae bacterium]|nr:TetR family transcriptional regulator [Pseudonocardiaceae bacterium]
MSTSPDSQPMGLRERKKLKTRGAIQQEALRLFIEQGYAETTVEQIAEAAEVSQSTFFRYFPTKEETVLYDPLDPVLLESFARQPAELTPIAAIRAATKEVFSLLSEAEWERELERQRLVILAPELRSALFDKFVDGMAMLAEAVAARVGRDPADHDVKVWAGAVIGVLLAAMTETMREGKDGLSDIPGNFDAALATLDNGLAL